VTKKCSASKALSEFWRVRNAIDITPAVNLLIQDGMPRLFAEDVVNAYIQIASYHKHSAKPTIPAVMFSGPVDTLHNKMQSEEPFFAELSEFMDLKWGHLTLEGLTSSEFDIVTLSNLMLCRLQNDYGKYLARSLRSWIYKGDRIKHRPTKLIWSVHGHEAITEAVQISCSSHRTNHSNAAAA
jgi:hypothetical protein